MKCQVVAVCGVSRTGSNYVDYFNFLHPDFKHVNPIDHHALRGRIGKGSLNYREVYDFWRSQPGTGPLRFPFFKSDTENVEKFLDYHNRQNDKKEFKGICFKADSGESWMCKLLPRLSSRCLVVACIRPAVELYESWKRWAGYEKVKPDRWIDNLRNSYNSMRKLIKLHREGVLDFCPVSIAHSHDEIRRRLTNMVTERLGTPLGEKQKEYLERRLPINVGNKERKMTRDQLRQELERCDPSIWSLEEKYLDILEME